MDILELNEITEDVILFYKNNLNIAKDDYEKLVHNNRGLDKSKLDGYYEIHHIIPKSLGGSNDINNLVLLTYEEHIKAHMLLYILYPENTKLLGAFKLLITLNNKLALTNFKVNLYDLSEIRKKFSESMKGDNNPSKRPEVRKKISENNPMKKEENRLKFTGNNNPMKKLENRQKFMGDNSPMKRPEVKAKISGDNNPSKRPEVRKKISDQLKGKIFSEEHKENLKIAKAKLYGVQGPDGTIYESASEIARILGVNQATVNRWIQKGKNGYKRINLS